MPEMVHDNAATSMTRVLLNSCCIAVESKWKNYHIITVLDSLFPKPETNMRCFSEDTTITGKLFPYSDLQFGVFLEETQHFRELQQGRR
jgi:hypothetical protein